MSDQKQGTIWQMILRFFKIGCIGFGGGTALIPVISRETVGIHPKINEEEINKQVIVASITPGALPVEVACGIGKSAYGIWGMLLAALAIAFPGVLMTILFLSFLSVAGTEMLSIVSYLAVGVTLFILMVITQYVVGSVQQIRTNRRLLAIAIVFGVFLLNSGKELCPILGISTIEILCIAFFVLCYTEGNIWTWRTIVAVVWSAFYLMALGDIFVFRNRYIGGIVMLLMLALSIKGLAHSIYVNHAGQSKRERDAAGYLKELLSWLLLVVVLGIPSLFLADHALSYMGYGFFSSIISFGGGDAYLTVADALFVQNGWVPSDMFYQQIIPVVNASPGSVLCETLSAVGYAIGYQKTHSIWGGYAVSLAGFGISVAASCLVFLTIQRVYEQFESLHIFQMLRYWMGTIIAGLLMSVGLSLLRSNLSLLADVGFSYAAGLGICAVIYFGNLILGCCFHWKSMLLLVWSGIISLIICMMMGG